ncbi:MAG: cyclic nucleotide-binding domain-containing protein [Granulosicoccus sp.]|nr:cyclic nucleotide-binding domain-containing protein [Granulosicoccus sp.]
MSIDDEYTILSNIGLFEYLDPVELKRLIFVSQRYQIEPGEYLFRQGDLAGMVFGIIEGEFSILLNSDNGEIVIGKEGPGELLGEMAAISGSVRSASVRSEANCEVIGFDRELFIHTIINNPQTALKMLKHLSERIIKIDQQITQPLTGGNS